MVKVEKIHPATGNMLSNRVVISNKIFQDIINAVNNNAEATNKIIDALSELSQAIEHLDNKYSESVGAINNALDDIRASVATNSANIQALATSIDTLIH